MGDILKEILKELPENKISECVFEAANIVLYTKDKTFYKNNVNAIKELVDKFKKRIELRPDPSLCLDQEDAKEKIKKIIPEEAVVDNLIFDPQRSSVIIECEKPGVAIGKQGALLHEIKIKTFWVPTVRRTPALRSQIIENISGVLYENSDFRRKFLHQAGQRIYNGWIREKRREWIRVTYLGGGRQVGRSCLLLQTPESRVLMDCGIDVANADAAYPHLETPEFKIDELDAVIISHSHLDHCGLIPILFKYGYKGPIYCTAPTRDVMSISLLDFVKIQQNDRETPLYDIKEIREMVKHTITLEYEEVTDITPDIRITFYNAGHVLGSSLVHLHIGNGLHNLVYTGDMKFGNNKLLEPAETNFPRLETLMIESTYGARDKVMPSRQEADDEFKKMIHETIARNGKVLMPVLGSGRAQEVMILLEGLMRANELPKVPIYVDGMVWDIMAIHTAYPNFLNQNIRKAIFHKDENPFLSDVFKKVGSKKERMEILEDSGPCIILATSGMLIGGPSVEYLRYLADNPRNSLIFSCFQGKGSLGRDIQNGKREFSVKEGMKEEIIKINLEVHKLEITDHSDRAQLMNYINCVNPRPKKIIINHGESSACLDLSSSIHKQFKIETVAPRNLEAVRIR